MNCLNTLTKWELRKADSNDTALEGDWKKNLPEWFKLETGFMFLMDGDPAIVVGVGGYSKVTAKSQRTHFGVLPGYAPQQQPVGWVVASHYKGRWILVSLSEYLSGNLHYVKLEPLP